MSPVLASILCAGVGLALAPLIAVAIFALPRATPWGAALQAARLGHKADWPLIPIAGPLLAWRRGGERTVCAGRLLTDLALALAFAWLGWRHGLSWLTLVLGVYATVFVVLTVIDLKHRIIPNVVLAPAAVFALAVAPTVPDLSLTRALLGAVAGFALLLLPALLLPGGLGGGDVKLAGFLGLALGFPAVLLALAAGIVLGGVATLVLLLTRRIGRRDFVPYGPFLIAGALSVLLRW